MVLRRRGISQQRPNGDHKDCQDGVFGFQKRHRPFGNVVSDTNHFFIARILFVYPLRFPKGKRESDDAKNGQDVEERRQA